MDVKFYEQYLKETIIDPNSTVSNPNFSIVMPGGCNGKCDFCFWEKTKTCKNYTEKLSEVLENLPEQFNQISITGGEPTISPYFENVLNIIDRDRYRKVVLTTNASNLSKVMNMLEGRVDHVNISRHHFKDEINNSVFKTQMPSSDSLKKMIRDLNKIGIDVTFSAVLNENLNTKKDIKEYIKFSKDCGATKVFFRKQHGNLDPSKAEQSFENYKSEEFRCPVCRTKVQLIEGMNVEWKSSLIEPSNEINKIFELIFNENGKLTKDWEGKNIINYKEIGASMETINEQCGNVSYGCDSFSHIEDYDNVARARRNIGGGRVMSKISTVDDLLNNLYDFYINNRNNKLLKKGDVVIYNNPKHKYNKQEFIYDGTREDGKIRLKKDNLIFNTNSDKIVKKDIASAVDNLSKFKGMLEFMINSGDLDRKSVEKFLQQKTIDPYDEEDWS